MVLAEADGSAAEADVLAAELAEVLAEDALRVRTLRHRRGDRRAVAVARRRLDRGHGPSRRQALGGRGGAARPAGRGGRRARSRSAPGTGWTPAAGATPATATCTRASCSTVTTARRSSRAHVACDELFELAASLGGSISGEHGVGWVKRGRLGLQWNPTAVDLHHRIKQTFDPKNLHEPRQEDVNKRCQAPFIHPGDDGTTGRAEPVMPPTSSARRRAIDRNCDKCVDVLARITVPGTVIHPGRRRGTSSGGAGGRRGGGGPGRPSGPAVDGPGRLPRRPYRPRSAPGSAAPRCRAPVDEAGPPPAPDRDSRRTRRLGGSISGSPPDRRRLSAPCSWGIRTVCEPAHDRNRPAAGKRERRDRPRTAGRSRSPARAWRHGQRRVRPVCPGAIPG